MPQRFLRPGITTSKRFNRIGWPAQSFYLRLITLVDDFGRYDAEPELLRSHAFPFGDPKGKAIPMAQIGHLCQELRRAELAMFYQTPDLRQILQLLRWNERPRAEVSKYEPFTPACKHLFANDNKCSLPSSSSSPSSSPSPSPLVQPNGAQKPSEIDCEMIYWAYPKHEKKDEALRAIGKRITEGKDPAFLLERVKTYAKATLWMERRFIPMPASWFNSGRFDDDDTGWYDPKKPKPIRRRESLF